MSVKCPYCYRPLSRWLKHPILLPNGAKYKWVDDTTLEEEIDIEQRIYKGTYQITNDVIIELQDYLKDLEEENLTEEDRTDFSSVNTSGNFQITGYHIKEMRDSVEKLLSAFGLTKSDYFNYDEDGNHIIHPNGDRIEWADPITEATDLEKFQVKYIHIEDLRHYIDYIALWKEDWRYSPPHSLINDSEIYIAPNMSGEMTYGKVFAQGSLYAINRWFRRSQCWLTQGAGNSVPGEDYASYTFIQNASSKQILLNAETNMAASARGGSLNYIAGTYNHDIDLSDEILIMELNNNMKIKLSNTSVSGTNYYGVLEFDVTVGFTDGWATYVAVVFATIEGNHGHAEGVPWYYIDGLGRLVSDPGDGGIPYYTLNSWAGLTSGIYNIAEVIEQEYGYDKDTINLIRVWGVHLHSACGAYASKNFPEYPGEIFSAHGNINLALGEIRLIA